MNRDQLSARIGEVLGELARLQSFEKPTNAQLERAQALGAEFETLDAQLRSISLQEIRAAATSGYGGPAGLALEGGFGGIPGVNSDGYDRDPFADPNDIPRFRGRDPWNAGEITTFGRTRDQVTSEYRSRALSAVEKMPGATDRIRAAATAMVEQHDDEDGRLSRFALAMSSPVYLRSFVKLARDPQGTTLEDVERRALAQVGQLARAMSLTDSAGGVLVPFQLD